MKRVLSLFIAAVMLLLLPVDILASGVSGAQNEPTRVRQLEELRESNSDTYLLSDGSYECVVYADDKYFKDDSGRYVEIDHSIVKAQNTRSGRSYAYKNAAGDANAYFAENEPRVCVEMNGSSLSFYLSGANRTAANAGEATAKRSVYEYELFGKNCISYENVLNGTDLIYEMLNGCLKEYVLLKDRSAPSEYTFIFDAPELAARKTENGTVKFINAADEAVFELAALFAVDSNGEYTDALEYTVRETGQKGRYEITVSVSKDYLNAPERAFPVLVDPSVTITGASETYDSYVSEKHATTNYQMDNYLRIGKDEPYGARRTYIKFALPSRIIGTSITNAYLLIKKYRGVTPTANVYRVTGSWSSGGITWKNKPGYTTTNSGTLSLYSNNWYKANVSNIVQAWANGTSNYGFIIKDNTENNTNHWTTFCSSDYGYPNRPELYINYHINTAFTMVNYLDQGFLKRFPNGRQNVLTYCSTVKSKLEALFSVRVDYTVFDFTSYCDKCKTLSYGNWDARHLTGGCSHNEHHLEVGPIDGDKYTGFYYAFLRTIVYPGTQTLSKYFWTGHIPTPSNQASFSVATERGTNAIHSIVCMMPRHVTQGTTFATKPADEVKREYEFTLLHESSHQLGTPDHYRHGNPPCTCNSPTTCGKSHLYCDNPGCWRCREYLVTAAGNRCIMMRRYTAPNDNIANMDINKLYCPQCISIISAHLRDHHG